MKIALIIPNGNFLGRLKTEFESLGHTVIVNAISTDCDVILGMSISVIGLIKYFHDKAPHIPLITYNWDWYDHIDKTKGDWPAFVELMRQSKEVWSASKITAEKCERDTGIKSPAWFYAFILPEEWDGVSPDGDYIIQASRQDDYKRFDWFTQAAFENQIPFKCYHPNVNSRPDYIQAIKNCSFVVVSSKEESLGTLSALEGGYNHKPVLIGDFEGAKEVWGDRAFYYRLDDYQNYKEQMKRLWDRRKTLPVLSTVASAQYYVQQNFSPRNVASRMIKRLEEIL